MKFWKWFIEAWTITVRSWFTLFLLSGCVFVVAVFASTYDGRYLLLTIPSFISANFAWYKRWVE